MLNVNKYVRLAFYTKKKSYFKACHICKTTPPKIMEFREKKKTIYHVQSAVRLK